ncbi:TVP38/TMEM64 family protein [Cupriavidus sp. IK-TO18]|uniref:TVP38/TMEM64 family protein n=1 Tax=unclassified Cupriavidus TaxID=2640874 RepID=UPI00189B82A6|nr:TVP38/TMEM64 family protein [Cupriavidus sp. IK-TO18]MBF6989461.1 TVP38/TMEM64 family protein [Cupriavidus sp. IK-TO18]
MKASGTASPKVNRTRVLIVVTVVALLAAYVGFDLGRYLNLSQLKAGQAAWQAYYAAHPAVAMSGYFLLYVAVTALSLPGAAIMTLAGGAIFGLWGGTLLVSFASTIGATLAFLASRYVFRDAVQHRFGDRLAAINAGLAKDGAFYLFALRLVPLVPFFTINLAMGLTPIKTSTFYWVSQVGMLAGTVVYVNAGTQLAGISSIADILSPALLGSFALIGALPVAGRGAVRLLRTRHYFRGER